MWHPITLKLNKFISHKETSYNFNKGNAVLITGVNEDDDGAESNGTGKSTLIEGIAFAISGDSGRKVRDSELVMRDEDSSQVEITLKNEKDTLTIKRVVYSNTKSSELYIDLNGEIPKYLMTSSKSGVDIKEGNRFIFETLGITKDDFLSYYCISKDKFLPFLIASDTKKKEIISRFSGSDKIDNVDPIIQGDLDTYTSRLLNFDNQILKIQSKLEVYSEEIEKLENQFSDQEKELRIEAVKLSIENLEISNTKDAERLQVVDKNTEEISIKITELQKLNNNKDLIDTKAKEAKELESERGLINSKAAEINNQTESKTKSLKAERKELQAVLEENRLEIKDCNQVKAELNNYLAGQIECPKCLHKFILADKEFNIEEAKILLEDTQKQISDLENELLEIDKLTIRNQDKIKDIESKSEEQLSGLRVTYKEFTSKIETISSEIEKLKSSDRENESLIHTYQNNIKKLESDKSTVKINITENENKIKVYKDKIKLIKAEELSEDKVTEIENKITEANDLISKLQDERSLLETERNSLEEWLYIFKNFKTHLANKSISSIESFSNLYLSRMDSDISIEISGYKTLSNKKVKEEISCQLLRNGEIQGSYGSFSAGERARVDISNVAAIQNLINLSSPSGGLSLLTVDEVLDSIDTKGLELIVKSLQQLGITILIVTQNNAVRVDESQIVTVRKRNKVSEII